MDCYVGISKFLIRGEKTPKNKKVSFHFLGWCKEVTYKSVENWTKRVRLNIILAEGSMVLHQVGVTHIITITSNTTENVNAMVNLLKLLQDCIQERAIHGFKQDDTGAVLWKHKM